MPRRESRAARLLLGVGVVLGLAGLAAWFAVYQAFLRDLPDLRGLRDYRPLLASRVLDRDGRTIGEFYDERRTLVSLNQVPPLVVKAFLAAEDDTFFEHGGLDYRAILRAFLVNLQAGGEIVQGGSTITQQVAKTLLLTPERRYTRKIKDMLLARRIEQHFSKDEILYLYLNQIYFGHGAYGIAEAARSYFGVTPAELSLSQAALLAGLPKAPSSYSPHNDPAAAEKRRTYVLRRMLEEGFVQEAAYEEALAAPPELREPPEARDMAAAAWFTEEVRRQLFEALGGERVRREGLVIETTLDLEAQHAAVAALRRGLEALDRRQGHRGPLRRVDPGAIEAVLPELAAENGLAAEPAPALAEDRTLVGVVTRVDDAAGRAEVAFAPGLRGRVTLDDVRWARTPDPAAYPVPVRSIAKVLHVGDVARFAPAKDAAAEGGAPLRVRLWQEPAVEGALLALDVDKSEVVALVGGYDFARSEFNRATQARRQPGSAFKPIIYGAALRAGWTGASTIVDRPLVYTDPHTGETWRPSNYKGRFYGRITLRDAIARSVNNATIHLLNEVGVAPTVEYARALGVESPLEPNLSLALGASGLSLLELVRAYAVFPAQGRVVTPRFIRRVLDAQGQVVLENVPLGTAPAPPEAAPPAADAKAAAAPAALPAGEEPAASPRMARSETPLPPGHALSPVDAYLATDLLRAVITDPEGTGRKAVDLGRPLAGKTGTTNEQRDAWFIGFSPDLVAGVWIGFDERKVLGRGETGGMAALPVWIEFMRAELARRPRREFEVPPGVTFARIDRATGLLAGPDQADAVFEAFAEGTLPTETAEGAVAASEQDRQMRLDAF